MLIEAGKKRDNERQYVIEEVKDSLLDLGEKSSDWKDNWRKGYVYLAQILINSLFGGEMTHLKGETRKKHEILVEEFFKNLVSPKFEKFSRAQEEKNYLYTKLATELIEMALDQFPEDLLLRQLNDPQTILKAPTAKTCVPSEED